MGEYAIRKSDGEEIKIGTCESMYYLRADQRFAVRALQGNVDPSSDDAYALRFRFPWPDEDGKAPGPDSFHEAASGNGFDRGVTVPGMAAPANIEHFTIQFTAPHGYVTSLPCPESGATFPFTIHRNGFRGAVQLIQQKLLRDGRLVPILRCACGSAWRCEEPAEIEAIAVAFRAEGDRRHKDAWTNNLDGSRSYCGQEWWHQIADRILLDAQLLTEAAR